MDCIPDILAAQAGDREARARVLAANRGLVWSFIKRFPRDKIRQFSDDLFQEGLLGLDSAISKFDPARGCRFSTLASQWIRSRMRRFLIEKGGRGIHFPQWAYHAGLHRPKVGEEPHPRIVGREDGEQPIELTEDIGLALRFIDERERKIIDMRIRQEMTLREVSMVVGVSKERVRQIEAKALARMRGVLAA